MCSCVTTTMKSNNVFIWRSKSRCSGTIFDAHLLLVLIVNCSFASSFVLSPRTRVFKFIYCFSILFHTHKFRKMSAKAGGSSAGGSGASGSGANSRKRKANQTSPNDDDQAANSSGKKKGNKSSSASEATVVANGSGASGSGASGSGSSVSRKRKANETSPNDVDPATGSHKRKKHSSLSHEGHTYHYNGGTTDGSTEYWECSEYVIFSSA